MFLPWIVIQELDYIKDGKNAHEFLRKRAQIAIKFINACLQSDKKILQGQNMSDVMQNMTPNTCADDAILNCCLQILRRKNRVILLSNDVNLRNKALLNNIPAYGHDEIVAILDPFRKPANEKVCKIEEIKTSLSHLISMIIVKEIKESYGSIWNRMGGMSKPPWSLEGCLERLLNYWTSVFNFSLQKNAKEHFLEFKNFLKKESNSPRQKTCI
ncbi:transcriptional protein SWT1-like [Agrilus planipennis]|uniref:Transcriptional protein SWT1-like n=1 Tax=Agrilus planipennis TaxID=224129 RepID=A0A7F5R694_AGRPL|nr:transcriptional protein SWT1-like [Agrilus planipennis]